MTRRNHLEWHLVGESSDPVPADRWDVDRVADEFDDRARVMHQAASALARIAGGEGWTGRAAEEFADKADEADADLAKAAEKYHDAGQALSTYAEAVQTARDETAAAVADAVDADSRRRANAASLLDGVDEPSEELREADGRRADRHTDAVSDLGAARVRLENAMSALQSAANAAKSKIDAASAHFKDSKWDDIKGAVSAAIKALVDVLSIIAVIVAVVIIALLVIGPGGAFLAFLLTLSLVLGAVIFALTAVQVAMGDAGWDDLAWASLGLLGGGLGKLGSAISRPAMAAARNLQALRVAANARANLHWLPRFAQRIPISFIRNLGNAAETRAVNVALQGLDDALEAGTSTARLLRGLQVDEIATTLRQIKIMRGMDITPEIAALLSRASGGVTVSGLGALGQITANLHDLGEGIGKVIDLPETIGDLTNVGELDLSHLDFVLDEIDDAFGSRSVPAGR